MQITEVLAMGSATLNSPMFRSQSVSGSLRRWRWPSHLLAWLADTHTLTPQTEANIAEITKV